MTEPIVPLDRVALMRLHLDNYAAMNKAMDQSIWARGVRHMNYGYQCTDDDHDEVRRRQGPFVLRCRDNVRLLDQMTSGFDGAGERHLDVSCGRGGTMHYVRHRWPSLASVGVDLSVAALLRSPRGAVRGDALVLPFPDATFDLVTNVEASHCYSDLHTFLLEVRRVLRPGGTFAYGDVVLGQDVPEHHRDLEAAGLLPSWIRDVTANVVLARSRRGRFQRLAFGRTSRARGIDNLCALPGTEVYAALADGRLRYVLSSSTPAGDRPDEGRHGGPDDSVRPTASKATQLLGRIK